MEGKLPVLKAIDIIRALQGLGLYKARQSGSHIILKHLDGRRTSVPFHGNRDISRGLLARILNEAGISRDRFLSAP